MQMNELEKYADFLFKIAMHKCGNLEDAKDITQETLLSALANLSKDENIQNQEAWLCKIMNNKFYDMLRQKYKKPTVSFDLLSQDIIHENDEFDNVIKSEEAESIRCQISYLTKLYREVTVRYYMNGESVVQIAKTLKIPVGTVKSRLDSGRNIIKKGIENMENYTKQSYQPEQLYIPNSGQCGMNNEPASVVENDKIAQNILIIAYDKPVTVLELSKAIGIPTVYIEPIIEKLLANQLMKRTDGGKIYTDFILYKLEDKLKHVSAQEEFAVNNFESFWQPINKGLEEVRNMNCYATFNDRQQKKLEYYFILHTLLNTIFGAGDQYYKPNHYENFPDRLNGGKWIAFGQVYPEGFDIGKSPDSKYGISGERNVSFTRFINSKYIELHEYDTALNVPHPYSDLNYSMSTDDMVKLLYIIHSGLNPDDTGFNHILFENIPKFAECGVLSLEDGRAKVDIPVMTSESYNQCRKISQDIVAIMIQNIKEPFFEHLKTCKQAIPSHLKSVPEQKQYLLGMGCIPMAMVFEAKKRGLLFNDIDYICPPMVLVIDK